MTDKIRHELGVEQGRARQGVGSIRATLVLLCWLPDVFDDGVWSRRELLLKSSYLACWLQEDSENWRGKENRPSWPWQVIWMPSY